MKLQWFALPLVLALSACGAGVSMPPAIPLGCMAEGAIYRLDGAPSAELRLVKPPHALNAASDLAARVDFEGETYWFAFTSSLGFSRNYIGRTEDPFEAARREDTGEDAGETAREPEYEGSEYVGLDVNFDQIESVPRADTPAPAFIVANGVAASIWYSEPRRVLPKATWRLAGCGQS